MRPGPRVEVERAKKSAGSSEPSQNSIKNFRARASRANLLSKISELERAEPNFLQKFPRPSESSFGSSCRAKKRAKFSSFSMVWRAGRARWASKLHLVVTCNNNMYMYVVDNSYVYIGLSSRQWSFWLEHKSSLWSICLRFSLTESLRSSSSHWTWLNIWANK